MSKYWHVVSLGIQSMLVYRANFFFRAVFNLIPLLAIIALWRTIYQDSANAISGYTLAQMVSYYLLVTVSDSLTSVVPVVRPVARPP